MIEALSARETIIIRRALKTALAVSNCTADNGGPSNEIFVVSLHKKVNDSSSPEATMSRAAARTRDHKAFKKDSAHRVRVE